MRYAGRIAEWNDARGFGFVEPNGGGERAFVHIRAFPRGRRPIEGMRVTYTVQRDERKRVNAIDVRLATTSAKASHTDHAATRLPRKWIGLATLACFAFAAWRHKLPLPVLLLYTGMSAITLAAYAHDKSAARHNAWRTKESTLHAFAFFGGWPGALIAQDLLRHKSSKASFQAMFWCTVVANVIALAWWMSQQ